MEERGRRIVLEGVGAEELCLEPKEGDYEKVFFFFFFDCFLIFWFFLIFFDFFFVSGEMEFKE